MKANQWAYRAVNHTCTNDGTKLAQGFNDAQSQCDYYGKCAVDVIEDTNAKYNYGPGAEGINTLKPYHVQIDFHEKDAKFHSYTITLT